MAQILPGGCYCGAVRFEVEAEQLFDSGLCHCSICQRFSGAPAVAWANLPARGFRITRGRPRGFASSERWERFFCTSCGCPVYGRHPRPSDDGSDLVCFSQLSLDDPRAVPPAAHVWYSSRWPWFEPADTLPRFPEGELPHPSERPRREPVEPAPLPKLYTSLAPWWPLLSAPADYAEEAAFYERALVGACDGPMRTLLELGSGGGNNASHLKARYEMVLVDRSPQMLAVSRALNPECEHVRGDMRDVRLGRQFDAVFVHDAIVYMTTEACLRSAIETAYVHLRPGGAALFSPDEIRERYEPKTGHGGHDGGTGDRRALRYLSWSWDPDPNDHTIVTDFAYLLREGDGSLRIEHDRHVEGLFARADWLRLLSEVGFEPTVVPFEHSEIESGSQELYVARKPRG